MPATPPGEDETEPGAPLGSAPDGDLEAQHMLAQLRRRLADVDAPPIALHRYELGAKLGEGGMGVVYRARDTQLRRDVALKVLLGGHSDARAGREARALAKLNHPNIVEIYDVGQTDERLWIAMELVEGPSLERWLAAGRSPAAILDVFVAAAAGLSQAHRASVAHRDFKPSNVLLTEDGTAKVADFGLATEVADGVPTDVSRPNGSVSGPGRDDPDRITRTGARLGTPAYMAPEQALGLRAGPAADQFAWCVALFEALAGQRPFGDDCTLTTLPARAVDGPDAAALAAIAPRLRSVLVRGLHADADRRFTSMDALLEALASARRSRRWPVVAGAAALAMVGAAVLASPSAARDCTGSTAALDEVWSATAGAQLADSFESAAGVHGRATWARVAPALDAAVATWRTERRRVCETATDASAADGDAQRACLADWRRRARALIATFGTADATTVGKAIVSVDALGDAKRCREASPGNEPPAAIADAVDDALSQLEIARALARAGAFTRMKEPAATAYAAAMEIDFPPLHARAHAVYGESLLFNADPAAGVVALAEAFWAARELGMDALALETAGMLSQGHGFFLRDGAKARRWVAHGDAAAQRRGEFDDLAVTQQIYGATALQAVGDVDAATQRLQDLLAADTTAVRLRRGAILHNLGTMQQDRGRYPEAITLLREAIAATTDTFGDDHPDVGVAYNTLGSAQLLSGEVDAAGISFRHAHGILKASAAAPHWRAMNLTNLGIVAQTQGDLPRAIEHLTVAADLQLATVGAAHPLYAQALDTLALGQMAAGRTDDAAANLKVALTAMREHAPDGDLITVTVATHIGNLAMQQAVHEPALADEHRRNAERHFALAIEQGVPALGPNHPRVADAQSGLATTLLQQQEFAAALAPAEAALRTLEDHGAMPIQLASARFGVASALAGVASPDCAAPAPAPVCARLRSLVGGARDAYGADPVNGPAGLAALQPFAEAYGLADAVP